MNKDHDHILAVYSISHTHIFIIHLNLYTILQLCQDAMGKELAFSLGTFQGFGWEVINDDPQRLEFLVHYAGGDKDRGVAGTLNATLVG